MCYAVTLVGAIATSVVWNRTRNMKTYWLLLLFFGGSIFGILDHVWKGDLFFSANIGDDILLGLFISLTILAAWIVMCVKYRIKDKVVVKNNIDK